MTRLKGNCRVEDLFFFFFVTVKVIAVIFIFQKDLILYFSLLTLEKMMKSIQIVQLLVDPKHQLCHRKFNLKLL